MTSKTCFLIAWGILLFDVLVAATTNLYYADKQTLIRVTYLIMFTISSFGVFLAIRQKERRRYLFLNILTALFSGLLSLAIQTDFLGAIN